MSTRRTVAGLCALFAGIAFGPVLAAAPAMAASHEVNLRDMPGSYRAGTPGGLDVAVSAKRKARCVLVRHVLTIRLDGLSPDRIRVERAVSGTWRSVPVTAASGGVRVAAQSPDPTPLCRGRTATARFRVTFLAGVPGGQATVVAEAFSSRGASLGRDTATRRVTGAPAPTPAPTASPTPTPTPQPTEAGVPAGQPAVAERAAPSGSGGLGGLGAMVIGVGLLMVTIGAALLLLLLRRNRQATDAGGGAGAGAGGTERTMLLPTVRGRHNR